MTNTGPNTYSFHFRFRHDLKVPHHAVSFHPVPLPCFRFCFPLLTFVSFVSCSSRRPVARRLCGSMFSWGEDAHRGFRLKDGANSDRGPSADSGVRRLELGYRLAGLSAGRSALAFVKANGNAFVIVRKQSRGGKQSEQMSFVGAKKQPLTYKCMLYITVSTLAVF